MKTIGLIGGMSWESSLLYYKQFNQLTNKKLGGLHSSSCILYSLNFEEIVQLQKQGKWDESAAILANAAVQLERSGADVILIATNTMHIVAPQVQEAISIPLLHIVDVTAEAIQVSQLKKVGLLATKFTMEQPFYREIMEKKYGIEVIVPSAEDRQVIHDIIFEELCKGRILEGSKQKYLTVVEKLIALGAEGVILGCTEIPLLIKAADIDIPIFDSTMLHASNAVELALGLKQPVSI
ncbi:aspartate racemase [Thermoactinomyces sp. DSM 45891]|uniref:aspartate/glutamate racemase family protein n=1 Tax=Thermoactinomyces sp. DSM 45891 TaxID=1761907 RepID=UPI000923CA9D|nr:aspartate/glutamate racemase family protein [Thermoactinomyces sp. DSM 45891]SFX54741.1 aspartate racemase [Thermoactinomyces sp. DSM 45891]